MRIHSVLGISKLTATSGGNIIAPDSEAAFYAVLDVLAKVGFG